MGDHVADASDGIKHLLLFLVFFLTSDFSLRAIKCTFIRIFRLMIPYPHNLLLTGERNFILFQVRKLRGLLHVHNTQNIMGSN